MTNSLPREAEVVVIGSGIFGAAVAYNLAAQGVDVLVVERGEFCGEASGANVGLITVSTKAPGLLLDLALLSAELYPKLPEMLGHDVQYLRVGGLVLAGTPAELDARRALTEAQQAVGVDIRHISAEEALDLEPALPETVLGGAFCPMDGYVYPFAVVEAYLDKARGFGARMVPRTEVTGITVEDGRATGVETTSGPIRAKWVVNAAGSWAGEVSALAGIQSPTVPVRGQIMVTEPLPLIIKHVILGVASFRQTWAGNALIGGTTEKVGHDKENTLAVIRQLARGTTAVYPQLKDVQVLRIWAGLRPGTPDEMPLLGESRQVKGFVVASGAFRNGMLYGPAVGQVIAEEILGKPLSVNIDVARPERFAAGAETAPVV